MITLFLCHASEDKDEFVRPLAEALRSDFNVWFDEYELTLGDSLLRKISEGLRSCDYGIVILSHHFFDKHWAQSELDGLFALETAERKVILPIWKGVTIDDVRKFSPILAGRLGVSTDRGLGKVVYEIERAVSLLDRQKGLQESAWKDKFSILNAEVKHRKAADALAHTIDGVEQVTKVARDMIIEARRRTEMLAGQLDAFELKVRDDRGLTTSDQILVSAAGRLSMLILFEKRALNSVDQCVIRARFFRESGDSHPELIEEYVFLPTFDEELKVRWYWGEVSSLTDEGVLDAVFLLLAKLLDRALSG